MSINTIDGRKLRFMVPRELPEEIEVTITLDPACYVMLLREQHIRALVGTLHPVDELASLLVVEALMSSHMERQARPAPLRLVPRGGQRE